MTSRRWRGPTTSTPLCRRSRKGLRVVMGAENLEYRLLESPDRQIDDRPAGRIEAERVRDPTGRKLSDRSRRQALRYADCPPRPRF